ncbi:LysR family transcriptional regulator [Falsibacillus albus]|uniref:LysR family transcriptional regulator n=1 Tax=Falsibacillus albus TaxID=2478915 RepID=A0A3L7JZ99_9BACI|nr:LysR family transcriptional regulator [Falsibacillus albus]RLQ95459.1 LysR family transcriptional regulator [Falsibacillus albus]
MEMKWLHTFISAAKHENFRKASEELFISQPSVSIHIKLIEEELSCKLFNKKGRNILLTEEGKRFLPHAVSMIDQYDKSLLEIHRMKQGYSQSLNLGISPLIADTIMPFVLKQFMNAFPAVEISVQIIESLAIESAVHKGEVDIGLSCLQIQNADLICRLLYEDPVIFVAPHDGRDSETAPPLDVLELLADYHLITHNHPDYWDKLLRTIRTKAAGLKTMTVSQVHVTKRFIVEGLGVSFLPSSTVRRELMEGRLLEVPCTGFQMPTAKTFAVLKYEHSLEKKFLEFLSQYRI